VRVDSGLSCQKHPDNAKLKMKGYFGYSSEIMLVRLAKVLEPAENSLDCCPLLDCCFEFLRTYS